MDLLAKIYELKHEDLIEPDNAKIIWDILYSETTRLKIGRQA